MCQPAAHDAQMRSQAIERLHQQRPEIIQYVTEVP